MITIQLVLCLLFVAENGFPVARKLLKQIPTFMLATRLGSLNHCRPIISSYHTSIRAFHRAPTALRSIQWKTPDTVCLMNPDLYLFKH